MVNTPESSIIDSDTRGFQKDVLDASNELPVIVDFWAPWCGPCKQLTPALEKAVTATNGAARLVKINVDENQGVAGQMGIQSLPTVLAFQGGRPVDAFMGAIPDSEVAAFVQKLLPEPVEAKNQELEIQSLLEGANAAAEAKDFATAAQIFATILQQDAKFMPAILGLAHVYFKAGERERARKTIDLAPADQRDSQEVRSLLSALNLVDQAAELSDAESLLMAIRNDANDHQTRYNLAVALNAEGMREEATDHLLEIMRRDRKWRDDDARKKLLEFFDAWGPTEPAAVAGRRKLSSLLFS